MCSPSMYWSLLMKRRKQMPVAGMDAGTPEMARRFTMVPRLSDPTTTTMKVIDGTELDKLLMLDVITTTQHATMLTLEKRLHGYGFMGVKSPDYSSPIHADAGAVSDKKAEKLRGAVHLVEKMDRHKDIGRHRRKKLVNLVLLDAPWGQKLDDLQVCIRALDDIFLGR